MPVIHFQHSVVQRNVTQRIAAAATVTFAAPQLEILFSTVFELLYSIILPYCCRLRIQILMYILFPLIKGMYA